MKCQTGVVTGNTTGSSTVRGHVAPSLHCWLTGLIDLKVDGGQFPPSDDKKQKTKREREKKKRKRKKEKKGKKEKRTRGHKAKKPIDSNSSHRSNESTAVRHQGH